MWVSALVTRCGSSPHTRGAHPPLAEGADAGRIIPAYAGSTAVTEFHEGAGRDHPRIRGEHSAARKQRIHLRGSSPHTRGAHPQSRKLSVFPRIIPAYAGSTCRPGSGRRRRPDHPRIRGEHLMTLLAWSASWGSSPHTRGARPRILGFLFREWIIPAYAGSTLEARNQDIVKQDHPRIRGEHGVRRH